VLPAFEAALVALGRAYLALAADARKHGNVAGMEDALMRWFNIPQSALLKAPPRTVHWKLCRLHSRLTAAPSAPADISSADPAAALSGPDAPDVAHALHREDSHIADAARADAAPLADDGPQPMDIDSDPPSTAPGQARRELPGDDAIPPNAVERHMPPEPSTAPGAYPTADEIVRRYREAFAARGDTFTEEHEGALRAALHARAIVHEGAPRCLHRAMKRLLQKQHGVAPVNDETLAKLRQLHPQEDSELSPAERERFSKLLRGAPRPLLVDQGKLATIIGVKVNNGSAPGPSGWTGAHLHALMQDRECAEHLTAVVTDILNGRFTGPELRCRMLASALVPVLKPNGSVRPVAMGETLYKAAALYAMDLVDEHLPALFPRIQYGVSVAGGSERAAHLIANLRAAMLQQRDDVVVLSTDFANAFNAASRTQIRRAIMGSERCRPLWRLFDWAYGDSSPLYVYERTGERRATLHSRRGVRQGDPLAAFAFALCVQPLYEAVIRDLPGVRAVAIQDDLTIIGPADDVLSAFALLTQLAPSYSLDLQTDKCQLLLPPDAERHAPLRAQAAAAGLPCTVSILSILGTRLGCTAAHDATIAEQCLAEAHGHSTMFERLSHEEMQADPQVGLLLLRECALPRMHYVARTTKPHLLQEACGVFDSDAQRAFGALTGIRCERLTDAQRLQATLPLSDGGLGMRPLSRTVHAAYLAAGMLALADLIDVAPAGTERQWAAHPLCRTLQQCAERLAAEGADIPAAVKFGLLDAGSLQTAPLWQRVSALLRSPERGELLAHLQRGLQHALLASLETRLLTEMNRTAPAKDRGRLKALSAPNSARALTVLPTEAVFRLTASELRLECRRRLGLAPSERLVGQRCACQRARPFDDDHAHMHCCPKLKYGATVRHNTVLSAAAKFSRMCGATTREEPASLARRLVPQDEGDDADEATLAAGTGSPDSSARAHLAAEDDSGWQAGEGPLNQVARRADLLVASADFFGYADVSVAHPATATLLQGRDPAVTQQTLVAARLREREKQALYAACPAYADYDVQPIVLETYGGVGAKAQAFLRAMAERSERPHRMAERGLDMLAVALVKGNAALEQMGIPAALRAAHADRCRARAHALATERVAGAAPFPAAAAAAAAAPAPVAARRRLSFGAASSQAA
jgi:Reverse transcriptase (RNA-dependent DNA polymerase)